MKKEDLIALLEMIPDGAEVRVCQPTHDHWHTQLANDFFDVQEECVKHTGYHDADEILDEDADRISDDGITRVWVLSTKKVNKQ